MSVGLVQTGTVCESTHLQTQVAHAELHAKSKATNESMRFMKTPYLCLAHYTLSVRGNKIRTMTMSTVVSKNALAVTLGTLLGAGGSAYALKNVSSALRASLNHPPIAPPEMRFDRGLLGLLFGVPSPLCSKIVCVFTCADS